MGYLVRFKIKSNGPISFNKYVSPEEFPKKQGENAQDWSFRTWQEKAHFDHEGTVVLHPMMIKNALVNAAKYRGEKVPGQRMKTWTKYFQSAVLLPDSIRLTMGDAPITRDDLKPDVVLSGNADKKIPAKFPLLTQWEAQGDLYVLDDTIKIDDLKRHLQTAGLFIGIGKFRVGNGGMYGRFEVEDVSVVQTGI